MKSLLYATLLSICFGFAYCFGVRRGEYAAYVAKQQSDARRYQASLN